jgi:hypothetical protein
VTQVVDPAVRDAGGPERWSPLARPELLEVDVAAACGRKSNFESSRTGIPSSTGTTRWRSGTRRRWRLVFAHGFKRPCE